MMKSNEWKFRVNLSVLFYFFLVVIFCLLTHTQKVNCTGNLKVFQDIFARCFDTGEKKIISTFCSGIWYLVFGDWKTNMHVKITALALINLTVITSVDHNVCFANY